MTGSARHRLGVVSLPSSPPEHLVPLARAADGAGLDELWLWEDCFKESGIASAVAALASTERLHVGIGLLPVPLRNVALTAMELATVERLYPGRFVPGVGHGVQHWMAQVGGRVESPMTLLREYVIALRALLAGERVSTEGRYVRLDDVKLDWPPSPPPPLLGGGEGPRSLALCAELCDGTILTGGLSMERVRSSCRTLRAAREAAGLTGPHRVVAFVITGTGEGAEERYQAEQRRWGVEASAIGAVGDAEAVARCYQAVLDAGVDTVVAQPTTDEPDAEGLVAFLGEQVAPRLGHRRGEG